jgi:hypothetical protein
MGTLDKSADKTPTVKVMPESKGRTLCVEMHGSINREDYERNFRNRIIEITKKEPYFNLLFHYTPDYKGWEPDAADLSFKSIVEMGRKIHRQAYVNPPEKIFFRNALSKPLFSGETRYFPEGQLQEALEWVQGG